MTIQILGGQEPPKKTRRNKFTRQREKLNIREFIKESPTRIQEAFPVERGKVSENGWLIIETTEWVGFIHAGSSVATNLLDDLLPKLTGTKANILVAIPSKTNKYGFVLGVDDRIQRFYSFDSDDESFTIGEQKLLEGKQPTLTLNMFTATKSDSPIIGEEDSQNDNPKSYPEHLDDYGDEPPTTPSGRPKKPKKE